jgi:hypothetical protein
LDYFDQRFLNLNAAITRVKRWAGDKKIRPGLFRVMEPARYVIGAVEENSKYQKPEDDDLHDIEELEKR